MAYVVEEIPSHAKLVKEVGLELAAEEAAEGVEEITAEEASEIEDYTFHNYIKMSLRREPLWKVLISSGYAPYVTN